MIAFLRGLIGGGGERSAEDIAAERKAANRAKLCPFVITDSPREPNFTGESRSKRQFLRKHTRSHCSVGDCRRWSNAFHNHRCFAHSSRWERVINTLMRRDKFKVVDLDDAAPGAKSRSGLTFDETLDALLFKPFLDVSSVRQAFRLHDVMTHNELCRYVLLCLNEGHAQRPGAFFTESRAIASLYESGLFSLDTTQDWLVVDTRSDEEMDFLVDSMEDLPDPDEDTDNSDAWWVTALRSAMQRKHRASEDPILAALERSDKALYRAIAKKRKIEFD